MNTFRPLFYLILVILIGNCGTSKKVEVPTTKCDTFGTIVDMTGIDGCSWMIVADNGQKLLPQNWPPNFEKSDNKNIRFHFTKVDGASVCMAEDMIVKLDCIESVETKGKPIKPKCFDDTTDPMSVRWMRLAIARINANSVEKYPYLDKHAYLFKGANLDNNLYDCQGNLLCSYREVEQNDCSQRIVAMGRVNKIWTKKHR